MVDLTEIFEQVGGEAVQRRREHAVKFSVEMGYVQGLFDAEPVTVCWCTEASLTDLASAINQSGR